MKVTRNWFTDNLWLQDCLKHKTSIAAVDEQGALLAVHLGQVQRRNDYGKWIFEKAILFVLKQKWLGEWLNSEGLKKMYVLMKLTNQVDFDVWKMFDKFNCEKIFEVLYILSFVKSKNYLNMYIYMFRTRVCVLQEDMVFVGLVLSL